MSLPSFPSTGSPSGRVPPYAHPSPSPIFDYVAAPGSRGAGTLLPKPLLIVCGVCTILGKPPMGSLLDWLVWETWGKREPGT